MSHSAENIHDTTIRTELLEIYCGRSGDGFLESLLDTVSDPIRPVSQQKLRRFHPVLVMLAVVLGIVASAFTYFTVASR